MGHTINIISGRVGKACGGGGKAAVGDTRGSR